jgi:hypothetical protein
VRTNTDKVQGRYFWAGNILGIIEVIGTPRGYMGRLEELFDYGMETGQFSTEIPLRKE